MQCGRRGLSRHVRLSRSPGPVSRVPRSRVACPLAAASDADAPIRVVSRSCPGAGCAARPGPAAPQDAARPPCGRASRGYGSRRSPLRPAPLRPPVATERRRPRRLLAARDPAAASRPSEHPAPPTLTIPHKLYKRGCTAHINITGLAHRGAGHRDGARHLGPRGPAQVTSAVRHLPRHRPVSTSRARPADPRCAPSGAWACAARDSRQPSVVSVAVRAPARRCPPRPSLCMGGLSEMLSRPRPAASPSKSAVSQDTAAYSSVSLVPPRLPRLDTAAQESRASVSKRDTGLVWPSSPRPSRSACPHVLGFESSPVSKPRTCAVGGGA